MTKDKFHKSASEQNNRTKATGTGTGTAVSTPTPPAAARPQPPAPRGPAPKPPFGMPVMNFAINIKLIQPKILSAVPQKENEETAKD